VKLKALALALFIAGACASFAVADDGHGKGKNPTSAGTTTSSSTTGSDTTTGSTTTTSSKSKGKSGEVQANKKVTLCRKAGKSGRFVKISVSKNAVKSDLKHGDVLPDASGKCPASTKPTTTTQGTTTDTTTTDATTTTNAAPTGVAPTTTTP
jgi:hypothetical protein